jgi:hypothetical protein
LSKATNVAPESLVTCDEGIVRYRKNESKSVIEISYQSAGAANYTPIGSFSVDLKVIKEHNGRIKDTFKGSKDSFPSWVYRETLGRTHQDIRNAIASSATRAARAVEREAEKAAKATAKASKKVAKATKASKEEAAPVEAPDVDDDEIDALLEQAKSDLNEPE